MASYQLMKKPWSSGCFRVLEIQIFRKRTAVRLTEVEVEISMVGVSITMTIIVVDVEGDFRKQWICRRLQQLSDVQFWILRTGAEIMDEVEVSMIGVSIAVTTIFGFFFYRDYNFSQTTVQGG